MYLKISHCEPGRSVPGVVSTSRVKPTLPKFWFAPKLSEALSVPPKPPISRRAASRDLEYSVSGEQLRLRRAGERHQPHRCNRRSGQSNFHWSASLTTRMATDVVSLQPPYNRRVAYLNEHNAWRMTLTTYCAPIRSTPVDKVDTEAVLSVLKPLWSRAPETASRLRGRIEAVLASAQVDGHIHIHADRTNPARWRGWLDRKLPNPKKIGERGHYAALPYADLPEFMARLGREPGTVAKALAFIVLTAARSGEALGMTWDEVDLATATWTIPKERMKAGKAHVVPLSDQSLAILRGQYETRGKNRTCSRRTCHVRRCRAHRWRWCCGGSGRTRRRMACAPVSECGPQIRAFRSRSPSNALPTPSAMR